MYNNINLFTLALGLEDPWELSEVNFDPEQEQLDIYITYKARKQFPCPKCQTECSVFDTSECTWRHLNFFQFKTNIHCRVPRIGCLSCGVKQVVTVGVYEISSKRGHNYVTVFVNLDETKIIYVTEGKNAATVASFAQDLSLHNASPDNVLDVTCDMSRVYIKGVKDNLPNATITFDKFHIINQINEAVY